MPLLEAVRIGGARRVYSWENPDGVNPDDNVCHTSIGDVCHVVSGGGVPTMPPFLTCSFCPRKNGWVKNNWFFETEIYFLGSLGHVASGGEERGEHL